MGSQEEFSPSTPILKQDGFGSIFLLSLLPVLMTCLFVPLLGFATQQVLMAGRHACRTGNLDFQAQSAQHLTSLLAFNEKIRLLRLEEASLKVQLAVAITSQNLGAIAIAQQKLKMIHQQFLNIDFSQKALLNTNRLLSEGTRSSLPLQIAKGWGNPTQIAPFMHISFTVPHVDVKPMAVLPDRPGTLAPIYEPQEPFMESQSSQAFWSIQIRIDQAHRLYPWLSSHVLWKEACGASLRKETNQWRPVLVKTNGGRFLSRQ